MPFGLKIVPQNCQGLIELFGKYQHSVESGLHFYIPLVQRIRTVNLAMRPIELPHYSIITKDNAEVSTSITLNYHVTDAAKFEYNNTDSIESMAQLVRGHLRDIIGRMELNDALGSTAKINADLAQAIGDLTNTYGINVDRINIDELLPSQEIQKAMDKQLTADRERVAAIAKAEGQAESIRLTNEAENNALIATAKAQAQATRTQADAERYRIDTVQAGLQDADDKYFKNQSIDAYKQLANSDTNLIVIPNEDNSSFGQTALLAQAIKKSKD
ncbi:SPFH domain-containing protein [Lactobacillus sp. DCY120]|uniref:SPFH domain-containing protein n=1 Tax=Bombilactobacillus apium TaxID=2675299 RepID=A0A850REE9_9LACO|nr:SPFH domain-containing protein [Bombilactobacillus apium]NVY97088.1 SPFH domain-containing protein [Bombilactobacillus apium]